MNPGATRNHQAMTLPCLLEEKTSRILVKPWETSSLVDKKSRVAKDAKDAKDLEGFPWFSLTRHSGDGHLIQRR